MKKGKFEAGDVVRIRPYYTFKDYHDAYDNAVSGMKDYEGMQYTIKGTRKENWYNLEGAKWTWPACAFDLVESVKPQPNLKKGDVIRVTTLDFPGRGCIPEDVLKYKHTITSVDDDFYMDMTISINFNGANWCLPYSVVEKV